MGQFKITLGILIVAIFSSGLFSANVSAAANRFNLVKDLANNPSSPKIKFKQVYDKKLKRNRSFKNKIIVRFKAGSSDDLVQAYFQKNNLIATKKLSKRTYSCKFTQPDSNEENLITFIDKETDAVETGVADASIEDIDIDEIRELKTEAKTITKKTTKGKNKTLVPNQWYLKGSVSEDAKTGFDINVDQAWSYTKGAGIKVAVIDTGFDFQLNSDYRAAILHTS